jgi:uncharacterized repeat protein (TIGR03803 family)
LRAECRQRDLPDSKLIPEGEAMSYAIGNSARGNLHLSNSLRSSIFTALALAGAFMALGAPRLCAQSYQDLHDFICSTGCSPENYGVLRLGSDGYLYGTTTLGGTNNDGVIYKILPNGSGYTVLWNFDGTTGVGPSAGLTLATDGNFYGTAFEGGSSNAGTLFNFNPKTSVVTVLHNFVKGAGAFPEVPPTVGKDFNLYGTTDDGAVYGFTIATQTFSFLSPPGTLADGEGGPMFLASDGFMYGTTYHGGASEDGTIYRMTTAGKPKVIHQFIGSDGQAAFGTLVQGKDGNLYGTTQYGGPVSNSGSVFKMVPKSPFPVSTVVGFDALSGSGINTDGANPAPGLATINGVFYGATSDGGSNGFGTLYEVEAGVFNKFSDFTGDVGTIWGDNASSDLWPNTDGILYGVTNSGGANGVGVLYGFTPPNPMPTVVLCCNWWVILDQPVLIFGQNLTGVIGVSFGSVSAQFQSGSATYLTADVPSAAIDAPITVTLATGLQVQSEQSVHILPIITNLDPTSGPVGTQVGIGGGGFAGATKVAFGGVQTGNFNVVSPALIQATVPSGAKTGKVTVVTPNGSAVSKKVFTVN